MVFPLFFPMSVPYKLFVLVLLLVAPGVFAADSIREKPELPGVSYTADSVTLTVGQNQIEIQMCRPNLVEVSFVKDGKKAADTPSIWRKEWSGSGASVDVRSDPLVLTTDRMVVKVTRDPCRVAVYDKQGNLLIKEHDEDGLYDGGVHFATRADSHFYGIRGWEYMDDSKGRVELAPSAQAYPIKAGAQGQTGGPFIWSNQGYGIFVNSEGGACHVRSAQDIRFFSLTPNSVTYYVAVGTAYEIQQAVAELTGKPPMFPKWALGFSNSEFTDMNEERCAQNVAGYRSRGIPIDLYTFDFQWKAWGDDNYGEFRWNPINFPNGPSGKFRERMAAQGIKLAGIMKPRIHVDTEQGRYATAHNFWVKGRSAYNDYFSGKLVNDLDFSIPECRQWFWAHVSEAFDTGIVGWWNDEADAWGSTWEGLHMAQAMYEGQRAHTADRVRVWTNNRNFFSGAQRYAYATWSGDIEAGFDVMAQQRERLLCSLNVGQERWGMDVGGFNNDFHIRGEELNESFARWIEFAAFVPIFRAHGNSYRQPWLYGPRAEAAARKAGRLRYSLIPYMYAYEHQLNQTGVGLVHPLLWDYPSDPHFVDGAEAWMFGDYLLAAPVVERGQKTKSIYLPAGEWIDYFRGTRYPGGTTIAYALDAESCLDMPLFIKRGAIIPSMPVQNYVGEHPVKNITIDVFPDAAPTAFTYYDDDGASYDYEKGAFFEQRIQTRATDKGVELTVAARNGSFVPELKSYTFRLHGPAATAMTREATPLPRLASADALDQQASEGWATGTDLYGPVTCVKVRAGTALKILARTPGSR